jgi:hypothetical protein
MNQIRTLEFTVQDLPKEVTLDLADAGGEALLKSAIESLESEVLYNSRFDDDTAEGTLTAEVLDHKGTTYRLRLSFSKKSA